MYEQRTRNKSTVFVCYLREDFEYLLCNVFGLFPQEITKSLKQPNVCVYFYDNSSDHEQIIYVVFPDTISNSTKGYQFGLTHPVNPVADLN